MAISLSYITPHQVAGAVAGEGPGQPRSPFACRLEGELVPFLACGDLSGFDADQSYPLDAAPLQPVAPPTVPPYRTAIQQAGRCIG